MVVLQNKRFSDETCVGSLSKLIKENGGKYGSKLTGASTQLVCSEKEWVGTTQGRGTKGK